MWHNIVNLLNVTELFIITPPQLQAQHPCIQPTTDFLKIEKNYVCTVHLQTFFLVTIA
jgi:hypothetical protein